MNEVIICLLCGEALESHISFGEIVAFCPFCDLQVELYHLGSKK